MSAEARTLAFAAPCLLIVPAGVVHGFVFEPETTGTVLTLAGGYLRDLVARERGFSTLFAQPARLDLADGGPIAESLARLSRELAWTAPGHAAAVESHLLAVLVEGLRLNWQTSPSAPLTDRRAARVVARFREALEAGYRSGATIEAYAERLAISTTRLRRACLAAAGCSPIRLVQDRRLLEAKRALLYSNMTVAEIAYALGFDDPAYFSRLFMLREGVSPSVFRRGLRSE